MSLIIDGTEIPMDGNINYDGLDIEKVVYDDVTVWEQIKFTYQDFAYTGGSTQFIVPVTGLYKLEAWGGSGSKETNGSNPGGYGGYACSYAYLEKDEILYVRVGSGGGTSYLNHTGWRTYEIINSRIQMNGAGPGSFGEHMDGVSYREHFWVIGTGGDCTHIAKNYSGILGDTSRDAMVNNILVVAGGGSGGFYGYEPQESTDNGSDRYTNKPGCPGGTGGQGPYGKVPEDYYHSGAGSGWNCGNFQMDRYPYFSTGGTNYAVDVTYKEIAYTKSSQSGVNGGNGHAKITFVTK